MSTATEEQIQWLMDRAEIHDLIMAYARYVDTKDWEAFADLFADDGCIILPFGKLERRTSRGRQRTCSAPSREPSICSPT